MPLLVTSASISTAGAHSAASRSTSTAADSFASVLDGTHNATSALTAKTSPRVTGAETTTTADRGSRRRSSDNRHTPPSHFSGQLKGMASAPSLVAATTAPAAASPVGLCQAASGDSDSESQSTGFAAVVTNASDAGNGLSVADSSPVSASAVTSADLTDDGLTQGTQVSDIQAASAAHGNPGELPPASETACPGTAQPASAIVAPSPATSDNAKQLSAIDASGLPLPFGLIAPVGTSSASLPDLLAGTDRTVRVNAPQVSAPAPAGSTAATAASPSRQASAQSQVDNAATLPILSASPAVPLATPASDSIHHGSVLPSRRSGYSVDKSSAPQASAANASPSDAVPPSPTAPLPAIALNPAAATATVCSLSPPSVATGNPSRPDSDAGQDAAALTLPSATAIDPAATLSTVDVARLIRSASGSELRVGVRSEDFGNLTIHATLGRDQLSAHISTENERLGSALATHLSFIEDTLTDRLGKGLSLRAFVSVSADASSEQGGEQARQQHSFHNSQASSQTATSSDRNGNAPDGYQLYPSFPVAAGSSTAQSTAISASAPYSLVSPDRLSIRV